MGTGLEKLDYMVPYPTPDLLHFAFPQFLLIGLVDAIANILD